MPGARGSLRHAAPYIAAVAGVALAMLLRVAAYPLLGDRTPFLFDFVVVVCAALYGGFWPGILALALSCLVDLCVPAPLGDAASARTEGGQAKLLAFVVGCAVIAALADTQLRARRRAERSRADAERAADALRASESLLTTTLRSIGDAVVTTDADGRVTLLNPVAEMLTGWSNDEARGRPSREVFHVRSEEGGVAVESPIDRVIREATIVERTGSVLLAARDGTERPIDESGAPIRDAAGNVLGAVLVFRDVTARRQAEEALRQRTEELRALVENSPDVIIRYDAALRRVYVSPAAVRIFGVDADQLLGTGAAEGFTAADREVAARWERSLREVFDRGQEAAFETVVHTAAGDCLTFEARLVPEFAADSSVASVLAIARDISDAAQVRTELADFLERQRRIAETLQRSLLVRPGLGGLEGLEVGSAYEAAWDEAYVGGDFYDAVALNDRDVALLVGDISGKGLHAAAQTAEIKFALRAYLHEDADPGRALQRLNRFLCGAGGERGAGTRVAVALVVLDRVTGVARTAASAAEPPLLLRGVGARKEAPESEIGVSGTVLGTIPDATYDVVSFHLEPGDVLLLFTDGITEARRGTTFFGTDGIARAARQRLGRGSLDSLCQAVIAEAKFFAASGRLRDDACVLAACRHISDPASPE